LQVLHRLEQHVGRGEGGVAGDGRDDRALE
jgi:hypothetical protein